MKANVTSRVHRTAPLLAVLAVLGAHAASAAPPAPAADTSVIVSKRAAGDFALTADPRARAWQGVRGVIVEKDRYGKPVPGHRTEVRSRWTPKNLYLLYISPYEELHLKPEPSTSDDTNKLWEWDVAEAFIGTDYADIKKYKEFQVSPQGEWVDLHIDRGAKPPVHDTGWDSGYEVKARVDRDKRVWYGEMRIPMESIGLGGAKGGSEARINLYRCQGPPPDRKFINWQPVKSDTFHTPEAFGRLRLQ